MRPDWDRYLLDVGDDEEIVGRFLVLVLVLFRSDCTLGRGDKRRGTQSLKRLDLSLDLSLNLT
jgi:hypothetical protein